MIDAHVHLDKYELSKQYEKVKIVTASDAHKPEDVGLYIKDLQKYVK